MRILFARRDREGLSLADDTIFDLRAVVIVEFRMELFSASLDAICGNGSNEISSFSATACNPRTARYHIVRASPSSSTD